MATEPKNIIVEFLRSRITDPRSRHTSTSDTFSGDDSETEFTLTPTSGSNVQCITSVVIGSTTMKKWQEYTFDPTFQSKVITFATAPTTGTDNIVITYDEGTTDWIYPDLASEKLSATSYPRMNLLIVSSSAGRQGSETSDPSSMHGVEHYQVDVWTKEDYTSTISSKVYGDDKLAVYLARQVALAFKNYVDDLYPKLWNYAYINLRDAVWETPRNSFHVIVEFRLEGVDLSE